MQLVPLCYKLIILSYCSSQAFRQTQEATEMLKRTREDKMRYEEELMTIKRKSGVQEALRQRLSDSEVVQYITTFG